MNRFGMIRTDYWICGCEIHSWNRIGYRDKYWKYLRILCR